MLKLKIKIRTCWNILIGKYKHYLLINIDDENYIKLIKGKSFEVDGFYCGLQPYTYFKIIKCVAETKDEIEYMLDKAQFEADIEYSKNKNNDRNTNM